MREQYPAGAVVRLTAGRGSKGAKASSQRIHSYFNSSLMLVIFS
jgi:hypothetical protein